MKMEKNSLIFKINLFDEVQLLLYSKKNEII